ncbi:MAG: hypothetical protein GY788_18440 [bacterium]|nr:hypothetical protein [bacterium]
MITPIIILCLLFLPLLAARLIGDVEKALLGGILGLTLAFIFFGIGHYAQTDAMVAMLPDFVPMRRALVLATGVLEFAIALGLLFQPTRRAAGMAAITVLILFFPANIYAAVNHTGMGGHQWGPVYLLIRAPLQALLIGWTWYFAIWKGDQAQGAPDDARAA